MVLLYFGGLLSFFGGWVSRTVAVKILEFYFFGFLFVKGFFCGPLLFFRGGRFGWALYIIEDQEVDFSLSGSYLFFWRPVLVFSLILQSLWRSLVCEDRTNLLLFESSSFGPLFEILGSIVIGCRALFEGLFRVGPGLMVEGDILIGYDILVGEEEGLLADDPGEGVFWK